MYTATSQDKYYLFSRYTGIVGFAPWDREHVVADLTSPIWQEMSKSLGWYYIPTAHAGYDGIRPVHHGWGRVITTMEDLEYYDSIQRF